MGIAIGQTHKQHGYIARVPLGNNKYRYFYSTLEIAAYKAHRAKGGNRLGITDEKEKKEKNKSFYIAEVKKKKNKNQKDNADRGSGGKKKTNTPTHRKENRPANAVGKLIRGYKPGGGKPKGISDADWERFQRLWGGSKPSSYSSGSSVSSTPLASVKKKKKSSKKKLSISAKEVASKYGLVSVRRKNK